eukprot:1186190-Prorocentrum_minimum.AAC.3
MLVLLYVQDVLVRFQNEEILYVKEHQHLHICVVNDKAKGKKHRIPPSLPLIPPPLPSSPPLISPLIPPPQPPPLPLIPTFVPPQAGRVLEPGDMLYLPPKVAHHGVALERGLTYSVGFLAPKRVVRDCLRAAHECKKICTRV